MLSLSNVRINNTQSNDSVNFTALVSINGRIVGEVQNDGRGGAHTYTPAELRDVVSAYEVDNEDAAAGADELIDELVARHEAVETVAKRLKKGEVVVATSTGACNYAKVAVAAASAEEDNTICVFNTAIEGAAAILAVDLEEGQTLLDIQLPAGIVEPAELPEYEIQPAKKATKKAEKAEKAEGDAAPRAESKMDVCRRIFAENAGKKRSEVIALFIEAGCTKAGASTYYQTCKKASEVVAETTETENV